MARVFRGRFVIQGGEADSPTGGSLEQTRAFPAPYRLQGAVAVVVDGEVDPQGWCGDLGIGTNDRQPQRRARDLWERLSVASQRQLHGCQHVVGKAQVGDDLEKLRLEALRAPDRAQQLVSNEAELSGGFLPGLNGLGRDLGVLVEEISKVSQGLSAGVAQRHQPHLRSPRSPSLLQRQGRDLNRQPGQHGTELNRSRLPALASRWQDGRLCWPRLAWVVDRSSWDPLGRPGGASRLGVAMEHLRVEVEPVGPDHTPGFLIHPHLPEELRIAKRLEHLPPELTRQVNLTNDPIVELDPEPVAGQGLSPYHPENHAAILPQGLDRHRCAALGHAVPVLGQRVSMLSGPLAHQSERSGRERSSDHPTAGDGEFRPISLVLGMEVRGSVIQPVHPDGDAVELTDPRHHDPWGGAWALAGRPCAGPRAARRHRRGCADPPFSYMGSDSRGESIERLSSDLDPADVRPPRRAPTDPQGAARSRRNGSKLPAAREPNPPIITLLCDNMSTKKAAAPSLASNTRRPPERPVGRTSHA